MTDPTVARALRTEAQWGVHFWAPVPRDGDPEPRDRYSSNGLAFRDVTVRIRHSSFAEWSRGGLRSSVSLDEFLAEVGPRLEGGESDDRSFRLTLEPGAEFLSTGPAGPDVGEPGNPGAERWFDARWRPLTILFDLDEDLNLRNPRIDPATVAAHRGAHGAGWVQTDTRAGFQRLRIDWKPDWLRRIRARQPESAEIRGGSTGAWRTLAQPNPQNRGQVQPRCIVVHNTGGKRKEGRPNPAIGSALQKFLFPWKTGKVPDPDRPGKKKRVLVMQDDGWPERASTGIHYVVDVDGHVVKMLHEDWFAHHAHGGDWLDVPNVNKASIGIEHVLFEKDPDFDAGQMEASRHLVGQLEDRFGIGDRYVVGHGDVRTSGGLLDTSQDRRMCPGFHFPWHDFEADGLAVPGVDGFADYESLYGGFFRLHPNGALREGDRDDRLQYGGSRHRAARATRSDDGTEVALRDVREREDERGRFVLRDDPTVAVTMADDPSSTRPGPITSLAVRELQEDLRRIGFAMRATGRFDERTAVAVERFQGRWVLPHLGDDAPDEPDGRVDHATALRIKAVLATLHDRSDDRGFDG